MAGLSLGISGRTGVYGGATAPGGTVGAGAVFSSPITGDTTDRSSSAIAHPASWVLVGAGVWLLVVYFHFHAY